MDEEFKSDETNQLNKDHEVFTNQNFILDQPTIHYLFDCLLQDDQILISKAIHKIMYALSKKQIHLFDDIDIESYIHALFDKEIFWNNDFSFQFIYLLSRIDKFIPYLANDDFVSFLFTLFPIIIENPKRIEYFLKTLIHICNFDLFYLEPHLTPDFFEFIKTIQLNNNSNDYSVHLEKNLLGLMIIIHKYNNITQYSEVFQYILRFAFNSNRPESIMLALTAISDFASKNDINSTSQLINEFHFEIENSLEINDLNISRCGFSILCRICEYHQELLHLFADLFNLQIIPNDEFFIFISLICNRNIHIELKIVFMQSLWFKIAFSNFDIITFLNKVCLVEAIHGLVREESSNIIEMIANDEMVNFLYSVIESCNGETKEKILFSLLEIIKFSLSQNIDLASTHDEEFLETLDDIATNDSPQIASLASTLFDLINPEND